MALNGAGRRPGSLPRSVFVKRWLPPALLAASLSAVYLRTLAPGLTWMHDGADGGDLITAAATGGVPHPSGYPLYTLLAGAFQRLPVGSLAYRTNLLSALCAVLAALLVYALVARSSDETGTPGGWLAGSVSAYAFGLAPLLWSQAVITEVYTLQAAFVALALFLSAAPPARIPPGPLDYARGLVLGLGAGGHLTTLLLTPLLLVNAMRRGDRDERGAPGRLRMDRRSMLRQVAGLIAGLCIYLVLPLRAAAGAPVNWGNAVTLPRLWWLVSGKLYQEEVLRLGSPESWDRLRSAAALLLGQFGLPAVILGFAGLLFFSSPARLRLVTAWCAAAFTAFALGFGTLDSYVYLLPAFIAFAIWIGQGAAGMLRLNPRLGEAVCALLLVSLFLRAGANWPQVDASRDSEAERFGARIMQEAPPDAILFARGDRAVFTLWYFHFALGQRRDLAVIAEDLLGFDWYLETLRTTYPGLALPRTVTPSSTIPVLNPERPACDVDAGEEPALNCG